MSNNIDTEGALSVKDVGSIKKENQKIVKNHYQ